MNFWLDVPNWAAKSGPCIGLQFSGQLFNDTLATSALLFSKTATSQVPQATSSGMAQNVSINTTQSAVNTHRATGLPIPIINTLGQGLPVQAQPPQIMGIPPMIRPERHVFITSKVDGHCLLSQWDTLRPRQNDRLFFRELRIQYISLRGFWRHYFGLKRFSHCDFHRVSLRRNRTFTSGTDEGAIIAQKARQINFRLV